MVVVVVMDVMVVVVVMVVVDTNGAGVVEEEQHSKDPEEPKHEEYGHVRAEGALKGLPADLEIRPALSKTAATRAPRKGR